MDLFCSARNRIGTVTDKVLALNISASKEQWQQKNPGRTFTEAHAMAYVQRARILKARKANEVTLIIACAKDAEPAEFADCENVELIA